MEVGVQEAASRLGLSVDAVRRRVRAGKLDSRKAPDGRVLVILPDESTASEPLANATQDLAIATQTLADRQARIAELEKALAVAEARLEAARAIEADRDRWRDQAAMASANMQAALDVRLLLTERASPPRTVEGVSAETPAERSEPHASKARRWQWQFWKIRND